MNYWEIRYNKGGSSGTTPEGRKWIIDTISKYTKIENIVDVGCGDLFVWAEIKLKNYTGIDISHSIIKQNKKSHPHFTFICSSSEIFQKVKGDVVTCFNTLYHIIDEDIFVKTLKNLTLYSKNYIFIYTWLNNPLKEPKTKRKIRLWLLKNHRFVEYMRSFFKEIYTDYKYQIYRDMNKYMDIFDNNKFKLISIETPSNFSIGALYIFKKT